MPDVMSNLLERYIGEVKNLLAAVCVRLFYMAPMQGEITGKILMWM